MSRWSDEFNNHPIHQLINQADEYLEVEVENTDAAFEDEKRRLKNVLGNLRSVVAGLDPDFYPKQWLDQIYSNFNGQVLNQLEAYSTQKVVDRLRAANDQATQYAPQIFQLAAMSRPQESIEAIANAQTAYTSFAEAMEATAKKTHIRFTKHEKELATVKDQASTLQKKLDSLDAIVNEKLAEWQDDFTEKQTTRAEEYSTAQIERDKKFSTSLSAQQEKFDNERNETVAKQQLLFDSAFEDFKQSLGSGLIANR